MVIIYEIWTCKEMGSFHLHSTYFNRAAAELMRTTLENSREYITVWIEEKYEPEVE